MGDVQEWYHTLDSRVVDLGDFAGDKVFIIEGDSLLLHCFSNPKLNFNPGLQLLHATYLVEQVISKLRQRNCVFEIVFFTQNAQCCIPPGTLEVLYARYLLAREAIIQHLSAVRDQTTWAFRVHRFEGLESEEFTTHLSESGSYVLMCHDGAFAGFTKNEQKGDVDNSDSDSEDSAEGLLEGEDDDASCEPANGEILKRRFGAMIYWFSDRGYNIALMNSLEFRESKVMAMVIEGSAKQKSNQLSLDSLKTDRIRSLHLTELDWSDRSLGLDRLELILSELNLNTKGNEETSTPRVPLNQRRMDELLEQVILNDSTMSQSQYLMILTISTMCLGELPQSPESKIGAQAMILHLVLIQKTKLLDRGIRAQGSQALQFFDVFVKIARVHLSSVAWAKVMKEQHLPCNISDFVDGTLFFAVYMVVAERGIAKALSPATLSAFNTLASSVDRLCGTSLQSAAVKTKADATEVLGGVSNQPQATVLQSIGTVLPFSNDVFDDYLKPVRLATNESVDSKHGKGNHKESKEEANWHNSKPLEKKGKPIMSPTELLLYRRKTQFFMSEMEDYAASLSGSTGTYHPECIVVDSSHKGNRKSQPEPTSNNNQLGWDVTKSSLNDTKKGQLQVRTSIVRELAATSIQLKAVERVRKERQKWKFVYEEEFSRMRDIETRIRKLHTYLSSLSKTSRRILEPEVLACVIETLMRQAYMDRGRNERLNFLATRVWEIILRLVKLKEGISDGIVAYVETVCVQLGLPLVQPDIHCHEALSFRPLQMPAEVSLKIGVSPVEFQLFYGGHCMERNIDSMPDRRTPDFDPDHWQRDVLDQIDLKNGVFIIAPTSAGKTFISFYAMKQVLKEDDEGILVYVAPTKALVNQITAEVLARFSKSYPAKANGKSVWAIHTRDSRINEPKNCQILITVPHILHSMLLSPTNAKAWTPRIKRIIFDEIHCIGQADDGVVWEQLFLLSSCPIIALSATVGNPEKVYEWLHLAQKANGVDLKMIQVSHRYSDLRKYVYKAPETFSFKGLPPYIEVPRLGLDEADDMAWVHPVSSLVDRSRPMPADLELEPRDCLTLWREMNDLQTNQFPVEGSLDPAVRFSNTIIKKADVIEWQKLLKHILADWMKDQNSPYDELLHRLRAKSPKSGPKEVECQSDTEPETHTGGAILSRNLQSTTLPLIFSLHSQGALPALFFNYDRSQCEELCEEVLRQLKDSETEWKAGSSAWKSKVARWNELMLDKVATRKRQERMKPGQQIGNDGSDDENAPGTQKEQMIAAASLNYTALERFDPERALERFSLADTKKVGPGEFSRYADELNACLVPKLWIDALERGIGVHHSGMNRKYRNICEILFRKGFLRVVFATGTLALGINMPCKSVVFSGDSILLNALNFRQAAGRAGRRGFDMLGNVIFQHVPRSKVHRLMSSKLPDLNGHFPITTSLVLRLFILLHGSEQAPSAVKSIKSLLSSRGIFLGGPAMKETVLHHLQFSIEYLRRNRLLDMRGMPLNFAGCISPLSYTEQASFAFHALLSSGYLQHLCRDIASKPKGTTLQLMLVMAHIFKRIPLRRGVLESYHATEKKPSSVVVLPNLRGKAADALASHNKKVLDIYTAYVASFIDQHVQSPDCYLPFSGVKCGGESSSAQLGFSGFEHISPRIISPFFALSGNGDNCTTISDLCQMVRSGVWLEESVIPYVPTSAAENPVGLNAYLYDFFKHGNIHDLERANRIPKGDIWLLLNEFSLILATINTSLDAFLSLHPAGNTSAETLDIVDSGDAHGSTTEVHNADIKIDTENQEKTKSEGEKFGRGGVLSPRMPSWSSFQIKVTPNSWEDELTDQDMENLEENIELEEGQSHLRYRVLNDQKEGQTPTQKNESQEEEAVDKSRGSMLLVSRAFKELQADFDGKFKSIWT